MYYDAYHTGETISNSVSIDSTWMIISSIVALVGGIIAYFLFVSKKNKGEFTGFVAWLHEFLNFKKYFINVVLKILYVVTTLFITLSSFSFIRASVAAFFLWLIVGNIVNRIVYEFVLMFLTLVENSTEINKKLNYLKKENDNTAVKPKKIEREEKDDKEIKSVRSTKQSEK